MTKLNAPALFCAIASLGIACSPEAESPGDVIGASGSSSKGCMAPTIWCSHNDPAYSGTSHGVPCFAVKAMYDFFAALP